MVARVRFVVLSALLLFGIAWARAQEPFQETPARPAAPAAPAEAAPPAAPAIPSAPAAAAVPVTVTVDVGTQGVVDDPVAQLSTRLQQAELNIRRELAKSTSVDFVETPLSDVVGFLCDLHQIPIKLQHDALEEAGITADTPVTCSLANVSLHTVLQVMLDPLDLTCLVDGEVLMITSREGAESHPEVRVYDVEGIATDKSIDDLIKVISMTALSEKSSVTGIP
ncbi:MAG: hypothetical protein K2Y37_14325 [Pirellulales bacterium]|nr:hypothetical protein [Pirellulales bacterium]